MGYYDKPWDVDEPDHLKLKDLPIAIIGIIIACAILTLGGCLLFILVWLIGNLMQPSFYGGLPY